MKLVLALAECDRTDLLDAHVSYHLDAGVDHVVAAVGEGDEAAAVLEPYVRDGRVRVVRSAAGQPLQERRAALARVATLEAGADWLIDSNVDEFWWPRAESLKDALVAIPARYTVVQALVRRFLPAVSNGARTMRSELSSAQGSPLVLGDWLRQVYRVTSELTLVPRGAVPEPWRVPLRAWYPIEVFDFSLTEDGGDPADAIFDTRLVDAVARLRTTGSLSIPVPDIVDDASYAIECAALGEADFGPIEAHIQDLELRIAALEAEIWPRVRRAVRRLVPRRR